MTHTDYDGLIGDLETEISETGAKIETITGKCASEGRDPRADERSRLAHLESKLTNTMARRNAFESQRQQDRDRRDNVAATRSAGHHAVTREPLTYEKTGEHSFFRDLYNASRTGDMGARQRLERHQTETRVERRDLSSTDSAGGDFVSPLYMVNEWVNAPRPGRPFANVVRTLPLPENTDSVNVPRVVSGAAVGAHADLGAVLETDPVTGTLSVPVKTLAGQVDMSRQVFDRSMPGMDQILFADLRADFDFKLDSQLLVGSGSGANAKGVLADAGRTQITYTDATPTVAEFYSVIANASQQIYSAIRLPADTVVMSPRRWAWICAAVDTTGRPLVSPVAGQNSPGEFAVTNEGIAGTLAGLTVIVDANLPATGGAGTNEDTVIVTRAEENLLFERPGGPIVRIFEEVLSGNLAVRISAYNYYAWTSERRPAANVTVTGTGLVNPW